MKFEIYWKSYSGESSLVRIVSLVLNVGEGGEGTGAQSVELVLEEHDLFLLLLDDVDHLALSSYRHDALARVVGRVIAGGRLEIDDLLTLIDLHSEVTSLALQLRVLTVLVLNLLSQLLLLGGECLQAVRVVLLKLFHLALKSLFVFLILLLVLSLDDLLRLLGNSVQLHVKCSLLVILDLQGESFDLVLDLLEARVVLQDLLHVVHLVVTLHLDVVVFVAYDRLADEDRVLVVGSDGELGNFNLSLLHVKDELEVELELFLAIDCFGEARLDALKLLYDVFFLVFEVHDEAT